MNPDVAQVTTRPAVPDDEGTLRELRWLLWDHHHRLAPDRVRPADEIMAAEKEMLSNGDKDKSTRVAEVDSRVVGMVDFVHREPTPRPAYYPRSIMFVPLISVRPEARRRGVGKALLDDVRAIARHMGIASIEIPVMGFNIEARNFYRSLGFDDEFLLVDMPV